MSTIDVELLTHSLRGADLANAAKINAVKCNLGKIGIAIAQNFGTRLWTSCTRLKTKQIKA